ncbi:prevent-host-death protein [Planktothrix agardhii 1029]|uniref:Putative prevent host death family protein n=1 Tax=Planktothrix agardhii (strain NIVA-CYA 126/8) TaxID=388467 RepID=A0A073CBE6_PLAA1|nr:MULTISPECIES: prevent-host-death protein [Planktothrix]KEI65257.1 putative prevent host death family protein [Planktothrix agardhii NIVA-CYA 126/8]MCB8767190.1 prevent-host-death protein [Planktothrix agardhii 1809]MCB8780285.1 prevent-host-death protein [Planktothrix agardhii 1031]MCB8784681.1 prevent-host-death protein [Planktothrix agardhii 1808]MCF3569157.1 prevent-host-death protein [Planktothrix agardhii 1807]
MNKITLEEITQDLINYLQRAKAGESFVIFQADQPIAKIISAKSEGVLEAFDAFRSKIVSEGIDLDSDEIFADVRDCTPTPEKPCW